MLHAFWVLQGSWARLCKKAREGTGRAQCGPSQRDSYHFGRLQQSSGGSQRQDYCIANNVRTRKNTSACFPFLPSCLPLVLSPSSLVKCLLIQPGGDGREVEEPREPTRRSASYRGAPWDGHRERGFGQKAGGESVEFCRVLSFVLCKTLYVSGVIYTVSRYIF